MDCDPCIFLSLQEPLKSQVYRIAERRGLELDEAIAELLAEQVRDEAIRHSLLEAD
jgi:antitoxin component of RelBE/YafQ-DinJ toxin-antitoxin module